MQGLATSLSQVVQSGQVVREITLARKGQWVDFGSLIIVGGVNGIGGWRKKFVRLADPVGLVERALGSGVSGF